MTKPPKLYAGLLASPNQIIAFRDFEALLVAFGFVFKRQKGSHKSYRHPDLPVAITIQPKGKDAKPYQVGQFLAIVREYGLTLDEK